MTKVNARPHTSSQIIVRETDKGLKTGEFRGFTKDGKVIVKTMDSHREVWDKKGTKTVEQLFSEKNNKITQERRKNGILEAFAAVQNGIIEELSPAAVSKRHTKADRRLYIEA